MWRDFVGNKKINGFKNDFVLVGIIGFGVYFIIIVYWRRRKIKWIGKFNVVKGNR